MTCRFRVSVPQGPTQEEEQQQPAGGKKEKRSVFGLKNPWRNKSNSPPSAVASAAGQEAAGATPARRKSETKRGRGKRPGTHSGREGTPCAAGEGRGGGVDAGDGWVMYADSDGFHYFWNEALQESR